MSGEVIGLPKFQLIRDFYDGLVGPFDWLKVDATLGEDLIERLGQIERSVDSEWFKKEIGEIISRAHVEKVRRCKDGSLVAHYSFGKDGETLLVRYSPLRQLIAYTFVADEPQPFEISAALCGDAPDAVDTTRWEDVVDFCWQCGDNEGCYVSIGSGKAFSSVWTLVEDGLENFHVSFMFGYDQCFQCEVVLTSREQMVGCMKAYLKSGMSAFQSSVKGWKSYLVVMPEDGRANGMDEVLRRTADIKSDKVV